MAAPAVMIGMMKCKIGGTDAGSIKSASVTVKPQYKEHKSGYPPITDFKALLVAEGVCKVDAEENLIGGKVQTVCDSLITFTPILVEFEGKAPGLGGTACTISGDGFGSGSGLYGKMEDFGYCSVETTSIDLKFAGSPVAPGSSDVAKVPFVKPKTDSQALTTATNNLIYGAPTGPGGACQSGQFQCSSKVRYLMMSLTSTTLDCAIMESADASITAYYAGGDSATGVQAIMKPGTKPTLGSKSLSVPTVGGGSVNIAFSAYMDADVTFNPGNDWNGLGVKYTWMKDVSKP